MAVSRKIISWVGYIVATLVGFCLYVVLRTVIVPSLSGTSDVDTELSKAAASLPASNANGDVTIESLSYDKNYNVDFSISLSRDLFKNVDDAHLEEKLKEMNIDADLCKNYMVKNIIQKGGSVSATIHILSTEISKKTTLNCNYEAND